MDKNIKVFVADVDGTLRCVEKYAPGEPTVSAFEKMHEQGYILGVASGRPLWQNLQDHYKEWNLSFQFDFLIGMNGGEIWTKEDNQVREYNPLSCEQLKKIVLQFKDEKDTNPFVYRPGEELALRIDQWMTNSGIRHQCKISTVKDISEFWSQPTGKILYRCDNDEEALKIEHIGQQLDPQIACFRTSSFLVEFQNKSISKGSGIRQFCNDHHISLDEVIGFGDAENDIEMLKEVGWSVALCDGMENVKAICDDVTKYPVIQDGVGHYLWDHLLNK